MHPSPDEVCLEGVRTNPPGAPSVQSEVVNGFIQAWSTLCRQCLREGNLSQALSLYRDLRMTGLISSMFTSDLSEVEGGPKECQRLFQEWLLREQKEMDFARTILALIDSGGEASEKLTGEFRSLLESRIDAELEDL